MQIAVVDRIDDIPAADFDRLDRSAGAAGSYQRTRQRQADGRWRCRYLRATDDGRLTALIPLYTAAGDSWPDPAYDPGSWPLPAGAAGGCVASRCLLVGSYADLRTGLPVEAGRRGCRELRDLLEPIARLAAAEDRCLVFPYLFGDARHALDKASDGNIDWALLGREAQLRGISEPGWESRLPRPVRYNLRHDRSLIAAAGVRSSVHPWAEVEQQASEFIAKHNAGKGRFDHPEFVKLRNRQWDACPDVELLVFAAHSGPVSGFVTGLVWRDQLEIYEIGLRGEPGKQRLAGYLDLVFRQPLELARARGLTDIRLGPAAERIKAGRGAVFENLYGGVLHARDTELLAGG